MPESVRYDVIIIGAGPAGLSASVSAHQHQLNALTLEKGNLANTLDYYYQRGKYVMSQPAIIPLRSGLPFEAGSREAVLAAWQAVATEQELNIHFDEAVQEVLKTDGYFSVTTAQDSYTADNVILAIGKLGNPRRLGIPGEELTHVADRLVNPQDHIDQDIVVIGGGDSAAEVALALADHNRVSMVYRGGDFYRMNDSLRAQILDKTERKELSVYFSADPERIDPDSLHIGLPEQQLQIPADWICVKIGAEIPRQFLERCGVTFASTDAAALPEISPHYESQLPGLYLVGSMNGQDLIKHGLNQGYEVSTEISARQCD
jgi:cGMP-dependent protein kinase 2